jgi:hypothetical protein
MEQGSGDSVRTQELESVAVPVTAEAVLIGPPLRGGPWLTANGPANESGHRRSLIPVAGAPSIAQRFAIDYVRVLDDNKTFSGDQLKNESYPAEGVDALAVANGTVVAVKDSIPENVPGINSRAVPITLETVGGNHVIIDHGGGVFSRLFHMMRGSLAVRVGQRVSQGQVLGRVGFSGSVYTIHLHYEVAAGDGVGAEGLPAYFSRFRRILGGRAVAVTRGPIDTGDIVERP